MTDLRVGAPDRIDAQRLDCTISSIDAMELNTEGESHLLVVGVDVNEVANLAEGRSDVVNSELHEAVVGVGELPDGMLRIGIDHDGQLDLAFELVEVGSVLRLGEGVLVAGDVLDVKVMLFEDILAFSSVTKVIVAKVDAASVDRNAVGEASILDDDQQGHISGRDNHVPTSSDAGRRRARAQHQDRRWCHQEVG
jgi:hypothetical protein